MIVVKIKKGHICLLLLLAILFTLAGTGVSASSIQVLESGTKKPATNTLMTVEASEEEKSKTETMPLGQESDTQDPDKGAEIGVEEGEDSNVHDPGVTILEAVPSDPAGIEHEDIGVTANPDKERPEAADALLKIDSLEREAQDDSAATAGEVRFGDSIRGARLPTKTSKPKEIVVVGTGLRAAVQSGAVEVRGWDAIEKKIIIGTADIKTENDLQDYVAAVAMSDENISSITVRDESVTINYPQPAKLFGIFNIRLNIVATVDSDSRVKLRFPWFRFLTKNNAKELELELKNKIEEIPAMTKSDLIEGFTQDNNKEAMGDDAQLANIDLQNSLQQMQKIVETMSATLKSFHDTARGIIRKLGQQY